MVKITLVNNKPEGGDFIEDTEEAIEYGMLRPGRSPKFDRRHSGQNKGSFSGSDKRELFTMKQSLDVVVRQVLMEPYFCDPLFQRMAKSKTRYPCDNAHDTGSENRRKSINY